MELNLPEKTNFFVILCLAALGLVAVSIIYETKYVLGWVITYGYALFGFFIDLIIKDLKVKYGVWAFVTTVYFLFFGWSIYATLE